MRASPILVGVSVGLVVAFIIAEAEERPEFESSSADLQEHLQSDSQALKELFSCLAVAALLVTFLVEAVLYYYVLDAYIALSCVLVTSLGSSLPNLLKLVYCSPRPYWVYDEVQALNCEKGWGNPSGHALFTGAVWLFVGACLVRRRKWVWTVLVLAWILLIGFDRVYLGVHFYSQVLLGWMYGVGVVTGALYLLRVKWLGLTGKRGLPLAILYHVCVLLYAAVALLLQAYRDPYWNLAWTSRIQSKCHLHYTATDAQSNVFIQSALVGFFPGAVLGFIIARNVFSLLDMRVLSSKQRVLVTLASLIPLLLQGGVSNRHLVTLCTTYLSGHPYVAWVVTLLCSYISGALFTVLGPVFLALHSPYSFAAVDADSSS